MKVRLGNVLCCDCDLLSLRKINTLFSGTQTHVQSSKNIYSIFQGRWCLFVYFSVRFLTFKQVLPCFYILWIWQHFLDNIGIRLLWTTHSLLPRPLMNARLPTHQVWKTDRWPPLEPALSMEAIHLFWWPLPLLDVPFYGDATAKHPLRSLPSPSRLPSHQLLECHLWTHP